MCGELNQCCTKMATSAVTGDLFQLILEIARDSTPVVYRKDQVLFYEGHIPYGLFIIKEGNISLSSGGIKSENAAHSSVVGFQHVLDQSPYCSTCTAVTEVKAVFLSKAVVQAACAQQGG